MLLRPLREEDVDALVALLNEPEVARWWGPQTSEDVREQRGAALVIVADGVVGGWLLVSEETDPDYCHVGFDIAVAPRLHGRGYGSEALRLAIRHYVERGHHRFTIDPAVENERAIRVYRRLGFRPVGVMRACERAPDGRWRDGLLMDLLADELEP